jgi:antitoxin component YwqK of YwqJK toxin-antitoxin module
MSYRNGLLQGETIEYYENGQIKSKRNYFTPPNNYSQSSKTVGWASNYESDGTLISRTYNDSTEKIIFQRRCNGGITNSIEIGKCLSIGFFPDGKVMSLQVKDVYQRVANGISYYRNGKIRKLEIQDPETKQICGLNFSDLGHYLGSTIELNNAPDSLLSSNKTAELLRNVFGDKFIENSLFSDSILNGRYDLKYASGKLFGSLEFKNDMPNGSFVFYDPFRGDTLTYKYFDNGMQEGYYVEKFAGKTTINRGIIPSDNNYGWEERYSSDGIPMSKRVFTKGQSKQIETNEYYPDGKLKSINNYEKDTYSNYGPDGKLTYHTIEINDSLKHYREYFPGTTQVKTSRYILNGKQDSVYSTYYPTGKPQVFQNYKNDKREGLFQRFDEKGELIYWGNFVNDLQEGAFIDRKSGKNDTLFYVGGKLQIKPSSVECACVDTTYSSGKMRFAQSVSSLIEYPQLLNYISPSIKLKDSLNYNALFFTNLQTDNNNNSGFASFNLQMFKDFSIMIPADEQLILNFNPCRTQGYISKMDMMVHYEEEFRNTYVSFYPKRVSVSIAKGPLRSSNTNYPFFTCSFNVDAVEYRYNKELELKESKKPEYCFSPARLKDFLDIKITKGQASLFNNIEPFLDRNFQDLSGIKYTELNTFFGIVAQEADLTFPLKTNKGLNTFYAKSSRTLLGGKYVSGNIIIPCKKQSEDEYEINRNSAIEIFSLKELKTTMIKNGFTRVKTFFDDKTSELTIYYFAE